MASFVLMQRSVADQKQVLQLSWTNVKLGHPDNKVVSRNGRTLKKGNLKLAFCPLKKGPLRGVVNSWVFGGGSGVVVTPQNGVSRFLSPWCGNHQYENLALSYGNHKRPPRNSSKFVLMY